MQPKLASFPPSMAVGQGESQDQGESQRQGQRRVLDDISVKDVEKRRAPNKHYVYVIYVAWTSGTVNVVHRTYADFERLQNQLQQKFHKDHVFCTNGMIIPNLAGRVLLGRTNVHKVALWRLQHLDDFCKVLSSLPPAVSSTPGIVRFFSPTDLDVKASSTDRMAHGCRGGKEEVCTDISLPLLSESYVAVADYVKAGSEELNIREGDELKVFSRDKSGWWLVSQTSSSEFGWVPYSYLHKVDGREEAAVEALVAGKGDSYMAVADYVASLEDEVPLHQGQVVTVRETALDGWWKVRYANREGYAPSTHLVKADSRKARRALEMAMPPADIINDSKGNTNDLDLCFNLFENHSSDSDSNNSNSPDQSEEGNVEQRKTPSQGPRPDAVAGKPTRNSKHRAKRPPPRKTSVKRIVSESSERHAPEVGASDVNVGSSGGAAAVDADPADSRTHAQYENIIIGEPVANHVDQSDAHDYYNVSPFNRKQSTKGRSQYEALAHFRAGDLGETDMQVGEVVAILERTDTGWWLVQSGAGIGWVPAHFLHVPNGHAAPRMHPDAKPSVESESLNLPPAPSPSPPPPPRARPFEQAPVDDSDLGAFRRLQPQDGGEIPDAAETRLDQRQSPTHLPPILKSKPSSSVTAPTTEASQSRDSPDAGPSSTQPDTTGNTTGALFRPWKPSPVPSAENSPWNSPRNSPPPITGNLMSSSPVLKPASIKPVLNSAWVVSSQGVQLPQVSPGSTPRQSPDWTQDEGHCLGSHTPDSVNSPEDFIIQVPSQRLLRKTCPGSSPHNSPRNSPLLISDRSESPNAKLRASSEAGNTMCIPSQSLLRKTSPANSPQNSPRNSPLLISNSSKSYITTTPTAESITEVPSQRMLWKASPQNSAHNSPRNSPAKEILISELSNYLSSKPMSSKSPANKESNPRFTSPGNSPHNSPRNSPSVILMINSSEFPVVKPTLPKPAITIESRDLFHKTVTSHGAKDNVPDTSKQSVKSLRAMFNQN